MILALREAPQCVSNIPGMTGQPHPTASRQLAVLRNAGIVTAGRRGPEMLHRIMNPKIVYICNLMGDVLAEEATRRSPWRGSLVDGHSG